MGVAIDVAGAEDEASSQLKRILAQAVLPMTGGSCPAPREALDVSRTDGSVAFAYRVFQPGQKAAGRFEIWTLQSR